MVEVTEEELTPKEPQKVKEASQPTIQDYKDLTQAFGEIEKVIGSRDPFRQAINWEEELKRQFQGTPFESEINRFLVAPIVMRFVAQEWRERIPGETEESVKLASVATQQKVAEFIYAARNYSPEALGLLEVQVSCLNSAFRTNSRIAGYNLGLINGIRGMVATMVSLKECVGGDNCDIWFPPESWDVRHDIDLVVKDKRRRRKIGVSVVCEVRQGILEIEALDLEGELKKKEAWIRESEADSRKRAERLEEINDIRNELDGKIMVRIPAPQKRIDFWDNEILGLPSKYQINEFRKFRPTSLKYV